MPPDPRDIEELFLACVELPPSERIAFLETVCGSNHFLRQQIDALLSAREQSTEHLETPTAIQPGFEFGETAAVASVDDPEATLAAPDSLTPAETFPADGSALLPGKVGGGLTSTVVIAGRYSLLEPLGQGGMGEVWVAQQNEPVKRRVALKLIKGGMDSRAVIARFEAERQALAMMDHPNIARVLDGGLTDGRLPFFVMELVDGRPLTRFCDKGRLTLKQRLELFVSICQAVQHAHHKGIVHRDLKPGNILVSVADGRPVPKVIDFGLAKAMQGKLTDETMATTFGAVVGTLDYMSPEQAGLTGGDVDTRSDIYSLGVILYELLTGLRPLDLKQFDGAGLTEVIRRIQHEEPPRPSARLERAPTLPELAAARQTEPRQLLALLRGELDWVVMKCLEKHRDRRYETANALARDLERYLANDPVEARPPSAKYRAGKFLQRNKGPVVAVSLVFLALVGGIIGTAVGLVRARRAEGVAAGEARNADAAREEAERQLAHGLIAQGDALTLASRIPEAYARYNEAYDKFVELKESLLVPEAALWDLTERAGLPLLRTEIPISPSSVAITPDNRTALIGTEGGALWLWDLASGRELRTLNGHSGWVSRIAISPDGASALSASSDKTIRFWDLAERKVIRTFLGHTDRVLDVAFSPDGKTALSAGRDSTLRLWDLAGGGELQSFSGHTDEVNCVTISPDGLTALSGSFDKTLKLWDLATGEVRQSLAGHAGGVMCVAISSDGRAALSGSIDATVKLWDLERGMERRTFAGHTGAVASVAFSPDGRAAFSGSHDGTLRLWDLENGRNLRTYGDAGTVTCAGISPDGRIALSGSHGQPETFALTLWDLTEWKERRGWKRAELPVGTLVVAADGNSVLTDGWGSTLKEWDLASGKVLKTLAPLEPGMTWFLFAADSRTALAHGFGDNLLFVLDLTTGVTAHKLSGHTAQVTCGVLSRDGHTALSGSDDRTLKLWDLTSGKELRTLSGHAGAVRCVALSPDGRTALSGSDDKTLRLWDLHSGEMLRSFSDSDAACLSVSISADGLTALSACSDATLKLWNLQSGELLRSMRGHASANCTARMTDDGKFALSTAHDNTVRLWDLARGRELRKFLVHNEVMISIGVSPDGRTALSGDIAGNLLLWDFSRATTNRELEHRVAAAQAALQRDPGNAGALGALGEWYAFRGLNHWGVEFLLHARDRGAVVPAATLARCYWKLGRYSDAQREFQTLVGQSTDPARREYFAECLRSVNGELDLATRNAIAATLPPLSEADIARISRLPAAEQIVEVQAELRRRNPEFDGMAIPAMEHDRIVGLVVPMEHVTDISPLRALTGLQTLELKRSASAEMPGPVNLAPLAGLSLTRLDLARNVIVDLSPLRGMPLNDLNLQRTRVSDLHPLKGMPLTRLNLMSNPVSDLSPLAGMPLEILSLDFTRIADLSPLRGANLKRVTVDGARVLSRIEADALRFEQAGDIQAVADVWRTAVETYALEDYHVWAHLIEALIPVRDFEGAVRAYQAARGFVPDWDETESHEVTFGLDHLRRTRDAILDALATLGRYADACAVGSELVQESPDDAYTWLRLALLLAVSEDREGYHDLCRRMVRQFAGSTEPLPVWITCSACLLAQDIELTQLARKTLADSDLVAKPLDDPILRSATLMTRAMLALRLGDAGTALDLQQEAAKCVFRAPVDSSEAKVLLQSTPEVEAAFSLEELQSIRAKHLAFISLAQHQLGHIKKARALLRQAEEILGLSEKDNPETVYDRLESRILLREARSALDDVNSVNGDEDGD